MEFKQAAADLFGITLTDDQAAQFDWLATTLADWNTRINLTAITTLEAVRVRHFLDSLSLVKVLPRTNALRLMDVGTGAGFPGLPLAILYPDLDMTLMDATGKKLLFIQHVAQHLGLKRVQILHARAEEAGHMPNHRAQYDVVVARSVARMPALIEYLLPLAKVQGIAIAMKGASAQDELKDAQIALQRLNGKVIQIESVSLPDVEEIHQLVCVQKMRHTPAIYPRKPGTPTKQPLV